MTNRRDDAIIFKNGIIFKILSDRVKRKQTMNKLSLITILRLGAFSLSAFIVSSLILAGCGKDSKQSTHNTNQNTNLNYNTTIDPECTDVRITQYTASAGGWCEFSRNIPILPDFVRNGMTFAVAEPWNSGSYNGESGEACGECWEIHTSCASGVVMMHDLCPIQGNPICAGSHFHFDLASEAADALQTEGLDAAAAKRVPCPVTGNIHAYISNWNEWGYMRVAFVNHRIPIRATYIRAEPNGDPIPFERSGGAWQISGGPVPADGEGVSFQFVSATGEHVEGGGILTFTQVASGGENLLHDTAAQFADPDPSESVCIYVPDGRVYTDGWGGIDSVRWQPNPWGDTVVSETSEGCFNNSSSCLRIDNMGSWSGLHLYYWQGFPADTFSTLTMQARTLSGTMDLDAAPSHDGERCTQTQTTVSTEWIQISFDLSEACAGFSVLSSVTFSHGGPAVPLLLDDIIYAQ